MGGREQTNPVRQLVHADGDANRGSCHDGDPGQSIRGQRGAGCLARRATGQPGQPGQAAASAVARACAGAVTQCRARRALEQTGGGDRRQRRDQRQQIAPELWDSRGERSTILAVAQMGSGPATAQEAAVGIGNRPADLIARHSSTLAKLEQRLARLVDRLLGRSNRRLERQRDLVVREAAKLAHDQCGALPLVQLAQVGQEQVESRSLRGLVLDRRGAEIHRLRELGSRPPAPER
jgi:hypothetical protein